MGPDAFVPDVADLDDSGCFVETPQIAPRAAKQPWRSSIGSIEPGIYFPAPQGYRNDEEMLRCVYAPSKAGPRASRREM